MLKIFKNLPEITPGVTIGFFDQSSPQTTANTQRFWSFGRPILTKIPLTSVLIHSVFTRLTDSLL
jgi:hypothetical protein